MYVNYISEYSDLEKVVDRLAIHNQFESWQYCEHRHLLSTNKMLPKFGNQNVTHTTDCICKHGRYGVPMVSLKNYY